MGQVKYLGFILSTIKSKRPGVVNCMVGELCVRKLFYFFKGLKTVLFSFYPVF